MASVRFVFPYGAVLFNDSTVLLDCCWRGVSLPICDRSGRLGAIAVLGTEALPFVLVPALMACGSL